MDSFEIRYLSVHLGKLSLQFRAGSLITNGHGGTSRYWYSVSPNVLGHSTYGLRSARPSNYLTNMRLINAVMGNPASLGASLITKHDQVIMQTEIVTRSPGELTSRGRVSAR
jgi:hypothetical protein